MAFEKVRLLKEKEIDYIQRATGMSKWVIKSYLDILTEFDDNEKNGIMENNDNGGIVK